MRILMLTQAYPPVPGGIERHVRDLGGELAARGHDVVVATLRQGDAPAFENDRGVRVHRLRGTVHRAEGLLFSNPGRRYAPPFPDPELAAAIGRLVARERPQIVHAHNWLVHSFLPFKRRAGARLVVTLHDYGLVCAKWTLIRHDAPCSGPGPRKCLACAAATYGPAKGLPTVLGTWAMGRVERAAADLFLPVSRAVAEGNGLVGGGPPFRIIPNFLTLPNDGADATLAADPRLADLPPAGYLLFVGAFGRHKGVDVLLRAYAGLPQAPPLVLIGYETTGHPLEPAGVPDNVVVLKHWPRAAVMEAWRRSAIALVPSVWPEPCPTVALEAMAAGRPVIASRVGGLPDLVDDGETGLLVPPDDPAALRGAIARLLADPAAQGRLGEAGRRKVAGFAAGAIVSRIEQAYAEVLGGAVEGPDGRVAGAASGWDDLPDEAPWATGAGR